jgi:hypothetical protein
VGALEGTGRESPEEADQGAPLADLTGGLAPDDVPELRAVAELEVVYPLLHALVGRSERDFLVRAAAIESLVAADTAALSAADLDERLYWLSDDARRSVLAVLRQSGWLEFDPRTGTSITNAGRWAYDVLAFLHKRLREAEILPTLAGIEYALRIGIDPLRHLVSMRGRLTALREAIEWARASHSEFVLRRAAARLQEALRLSSEIRAVLDRVPLDNPAARAVVREVHELLSRLHGAGSELHRDITEIGRQYIRLTAGLTTEQIVRALMRRTREELAAVAREALLPVLEPPPLLTTDVVASAAEQQVLRERPETEATVWEEPPPAPRSANAEPAPEDAAALLADLAAVARGSAPVPLSAIVPRRSAGESFLRLSLLALAGDQRQGEGVAGRLGALPVDVRTPGDGFPEELADGPLRRLTPGEVRPRGHGAGMDDHRPTESPAVAGDDGG